MKKLLTLFLSLAVLLSLSLTLQAEPVPVDDRAGLLNSEQQQKLTELAEAASRNVGCGIYILTVEDYRDLPSESSHIENILKDYYRENGYGTGQDRSGVILLLSMDERDYALYTCGFGDTGLSDPAMDHLTAAFLRDFSHDAWYNGFADYITCTESLLQMTLDGEPFDAGTVTDGEAILGIFLSMGLGLLTASLITAFFVKKMKSVSLKTDAENFSSPLSVSARQDRYTHTTTSRVYDPPSDSGSSGSSGGSSSGCSRSGKF